MLKPSLSRRSRERAEVACFVANFNLKVSTFLRIWYVYDIKRQRGFVVHIPPRFAFERLFMVAKL